MLDALSAHLDPVGHQEIADPWSAIRHVSGPETARMNALARMAGAWTLPVLDHIDVQVSIPASRPVMGRAIHVRASFGSHEVEGFLPLQSVHDLVRASGAAQDCVSLPSEILAVVIEHLVAPHVAALEDLLGGPLRVDCATAGAEVAADADLTLEIDGLQEAPTAAAFRLSDRTLAILAPAAERARRVPQGRLQIRVAFMGSPFVVSAVDLSRLRVGDGFLMPTDFDPAQIAAVIIGDRHILPVVQTEDGLMIRDANPAPDFEDDGDDDLSFDVGSDDAPQNAAFDVDRTDGRNDRAVDVPDEPLDPPRRGPDVEVAVQLARKRVPLPELRGYVMGQVIPMPGTLGTQVDLVVDGRRIARAELLRIDDGFGVRITELL